MKPIKINQLFTSYYSIPDYQRDYEWTNSQTSTLFEDIENLLKENNNVPHFIGAIVTIPYEADYSHNKSIDFNDYGINTTNIKHVIDGQQRLTSLCLLIAALHTVINSDVSVINERKETFRDMLNEYLLGHNFHRQTHKKAPRIILNGNTGHYYNNNILGISNIEPNWRLKGAKRLSAAFGLFKNSIEKLRNEIVLSGRYAISTNDEFYEFFIETINNKITVAEIDCDDSTNAFQVFDSLNGDGLELTAADRIKNLTMSWQNYGSPTLAQRWDALINNIGDDYVINFFISLFFYESRKRISKSKLPEQFANIYKTSAQQNFDTFFNELNNNGCLYGKLRKSSTGNRQIDEYLKDLTQLKCEQVYVLLFAVCKQYNVDFMGDCSELLTFLKKLTSLIVRMQVADKNYNSLDTLFSRCINEMRDNAVGINEISNHINTELYKVVDDETFKLSFKNFAPKDNKVSEFYVRHFETYVRKNEDNNRNAVDRNLTIEHIIPQTITDLKTWYGEDKFKECPQEILEDFKSLVIENIGNKVLLYGDDNSSASNNSYSEKQNVYKNGKRGQNEGTPISTFSLIKKLLNDYPAEFNHTEVFKRAAALGEIAVNIWK